MSSRKARGAETQRLVAAFFRDHGYPHATDAGAGRPGRDILNVDGVAVEVKARRSLDLPAWLRQCVGTCEGDLPVVVHRPDGFGPASMADWPVTLRLADFVGLLGRAEP